MNQPVTVSGRYVARTFIPDGPLPEGEGTAILVITPASPKASNSIAAAFGTAAVLRSGAEILAHVHAERESWGDR